MIFGSLFAGVGGFDLGLERAGMSCAWQVEIDNIASSILSKHWPGVPRYSDIRDVCGAGLAPVDLICGGFPCQDISPANHKGKGLEGEKSGLWSEYRRIVGEARPRWALVENSHHAWRRWVPFVRRDLWRLGYTSVPIRLRASDFGAPHERARCFIVAATDDHRAVVRNKQGRSWRKRGEASEAIAAIARAIRPATDSHSERESQPERAHGEKRGRPADETWWSAEPSVARVVHGVPRWVDITSRTKVLGNAVCPPIAEWLGRMITESDT